MIQTSWDYTNLADAYLARPFYSEEILNEMFRISDLCPPAKICDVGAGTAHLTLQLARRGFDVVAIEPNEAMRLHGINQTKNLPNVEWFCGVGEETGRASKQFDLVTFGSSFNVTDRQRSLKEVARIAKAKGWFACMWNHRNITDPIQKNIEEIIQSNIQDYRYGTRREDQVAEIDRSKLFGQVIYLESNILHEQSISDCVRAWRSHATLHRQAGSKFEQIITEIEIYLKSLGQNDIEIPYTTRLWMAQLKE